MPGSEKSGAKRHYKMEKTLAVQVLTVPIVEAGQRVYSSRLQLIYRWLMLLLIMVNKDAAGKAGCYR